MFFVLVGVTWVATTSNYMNKSTGKVGLSWQGITTANNWDLFCVNCNSLFQHNVPVTAKVRFQGRLIFPCLTVAGWYLELVGVVAQLDLKQKAVFSTLNLGFPLQLCHQIVQQMLGFGLLGWVVQLHWIPVEGRNTVLDFNQPKGNVKLRTRALTSRWWLLWLSQD